MCKEPGCVNASVRPHLPQWDDPLTWSGEGSHARASMKIADAEQSGGNIVEEGLRIISLNERHS